MSSTAVLRAIVRQPHWMRSSNSLLRSTSASSTCVKSARGPSSIVSRGFSATALRKSGGTHDEETYDEFNDRYTHEFDAVTDVFDLQRNLNNCFCFDLVPSTTVVTAALNAARRVNDFPTAVRIFEAVKAKCDNKGQYEQYIRELEPLRIELGVDLQEFLWPELIGIERRKPWIVEDVKPGKKDENPEI